MATIRVERNAAGNCLTFHGQTNPVYFNACLHAEITDTDYVSIVNDIATGANPTESYEYYRVHFSEWQASDFSTFSTAQEVVDYINSIGNVHDAAGGGQSFGPEESMDFTIDETHTSILMDNGDHHGVNAVMAIEKDNGKVGIQTVSGEFEWYEMEFANVTIGGSSAGNTLSSVVNALNALFSVSALGGGVAPRPTYTQEDGVDGTWVGLETIDPAGDGLFANGIGSSQYHGPRVYTTETINEPGEYWTFEMNNTVAAGGPLLGIGLYSVDNGDLAELQDNGLSNSGHHGYWYSTWIYNYSGYSAPWTTYGSNSGLSYGSGWNGSTSKQMRYSDASLASRDGGNMLYRCGITDEGFVGVWYYDVEVAEIAGAYGTRSDDWILLSRSAQPVPTGEYGLLVKIPSTSARIMTQPKRFATDAAAPTLFYRYAESPDGQFTYPLFASEEEANYVDTQNGGAGTSAAHVFPDDPTFATWYLSDTGSYLQDTDATRIAALQADSSYTEIPTGVDADFLPSNFGAQASSVAENAVLNLNVHPAGGTFTTTIANEPTWMSLSSGGNIEGTVPYVSADTDVVVDVVRTNSFGSTTGTLTLTIQDSPALSEIVNWTVHKGNTQTPNVILADEASNLEFDTQLSPGEEMTWSHEHYVIAGFANATGVANIATSALAATNEWDLKFSIWTNGTTNHLGGIGWADNSQQSPATTNSTIWKLAYQSDGFVKLYADDVEVAASASTFSGAKSVYLSTPTNYNVSTYVPQATIATTVFSSTTPPAGFVDPITSGSMTDSTTLGSDSVATLDLVLGEGERVVLTKAFVEANMLPFLNASLDKNYFGVPKPTAVWGSIGLHSDFDAVVRLEYVNGSSHKLSQSVGDSAEANHATIGSATAAFYDYAIEWDGTDLHVIACNINDILTQPGINDGGSFSRVFTYSNYDAVRTGDLPLVFATKSGGGMGLSTAGITKITIPTVSASGIVTPWTKAVTFSGSGERMVQEGAGSASGNPLQQTDDTIPMPTSGQTSSVAGARPWAAAVVFKYQSHTADQYIWCQGENTISDHIGIKVNQYNMLSINWGRGSGMSKKTITSISPNTWYAMYVDYNGFRDDSPTIHELNDAVRVKLITLGYPTMLTFSAAWNQSAKMTETLSGNFYIGGWENTKSLHGSVASMVTTALKPGVALPDDTEIRMMMEDPQKWLSDYKVGNTYRATGTDYNNANFQLNDIGAARNTQVWLMGDGASDAYAVIRNNVHPADQNFTANRMTSMVSNDIETVSIPDLS